MTVTRQFRMAPSLARLMSRAGGPHRTIIEGHLSAHAGKTVFVTLEADQCHLVTSRLAPDETWVEERTLIPRAHAEALLGLCVGQISFEQLPLPLPGQEPVLLVRYLEPGPLAVLTVTFDDQRHADGYQPPLWFGTEVTGEYPYERRYMALNGLPALAEEALSNGQLDAVLDLLDQISSLGGQHAADGMAADKIEVLVERDDRRRPSTRSVA